MERELSFIVPVYNVEKYLDGCLQSLYRQGLDESVFEVICVNDGSTDGSREVLSGWEKKHSNLTIIDQENAGLSCARNTGMREAMGTYLRFVDSDDYIADHVVGNLLKLAIDNDLDMLYTVTMRTDREDQFEPLFAEDRDSVSIMSGKEFFQTVSTPNGACEYFIKREFVSRNNFLFEPGRCCEDGMFTLSCISKAERVAKCNVDFYRYVKRPGSITTSKNAAHQKKMIDDFCYAICYIDRLVREHADCKEFVECLAHRRDSYTFFLQIRMARSSVETGTLTDYIKVLEDRQCYPNGGLTSNYGWKMVLLSRLFQKKALFFILLKASRNQTIRTLFEVLNKVGRIRGE